MYAENRKAFFEYEILEKFQAGIVLEGHEVKAVRQGKVSIIGSYAKIFNNELFLVGAVIQPYQAANLHKEYDSQRTRKLLLKKSEINYLLGKLNERRLTLVPIKVYNIKGLIK